jgi:hypothetical protein
MSVRALPFVTEAAKKGATGDQSELASVYIRGVTGRSKVYVVP